jgi:hypothetical protein
VLGNLPRSRPSVRSPRRADAQAKARAKAERSRTAAETTPEEAKRPAPEADAGADGPMSRERELEELAKAGLSLAGGAATLGLKAAGRAAAALRGAVERR